MDDTLLERIRKVQGYLKSDNPNEAAVAAAKLSEMLMKHNLTMSDIPDAARPVDPFVNVATDTDSKRLADWRITLGGAIAKANLCKIVISGSRLQWLGRKSNIEVAQYIYETCANDLQRICDGLWYAIYDMLKGTEGLVNGKTWKREFLAGAAVGVRQKLTEETEKWIEENANVNALIVTNGRELAQYSYSQYGQLGHRTGGYAGGGNAYGLGVKTGRNVSFRTGVGAGGGSAQKRIGG